MSEQPKLLIITTNRTAAGEPVYAPCGDVQGLIAKWRNEHPDDNTALCSEDCADELEAALKPSGELFTAKPSKIEIAYGEPAARPLEIGVEYPKEEVKP